MYQSHALNLVSYYGPCLKIEIRWYMEYGGMPYNQFILEKGINNQGLLIPSNLLDPVGNKTSPTNSVAMSNYITDIS